MKKKKSANKDTRKFCYAVEEIHENLESVNTVAVFLEMFDADKLVNELFQSGKGEYCVRKFPLLTSLREYYQEERAAKIIKALQKLTREERVLLGHNDIIDDDDEETDEEHVIEHPQDSDL